MLRISGVSVVLQKPEDRRMQKRYTDEQIAYALRHRKLKQLVADLSLDKHMLQDVISRKL
jgi:hypothetical protein